MRTTGLHACHAPCLRWSDTITNEISNGCMVVQALIRTLWLSGSYAALEMLVAAVYIFGAHIPLFLYG